MIAIYFDMHMIKKADGETIKQIYKILIVESRWWYLIVYYTILSTLLYVWKLSLKNVGGKWSLGLILMQVYLRPKVKYWVIPREFFSYAKSETEIMD